MLYQATKPKEEQTKRKKPQKEAKTDTTKDGDENPRFLIVNIQFWKTLSGFQGEQILPKTTGFFLVTEFFNVKCKCKQEKLRFYVSFPSHQKSFEAKILLENTKCPLYLNGTVYT